MNKLVLLLVSALLAFSCCSGQSSSSCKEKCNADGEQLCHAQCNSDGQQQCSQQCNSDGQAHCSQQCNSDGQAHCSQQCNAEKADYLNSLKAQGLIDVMDSIPGLDVYLVYSTPYNFMGRVLYKNLDRALLAEPAYKKLKRAQEILREKRMDLHFLIYDAVRPVSIQREMWKVVEGTNLEDFVANPHKRKGGPHNFGIAVDLTLCDCAGNPLPMGSEYDYFGDRARVDKEEELFKSGEITYRELKNRQLLREIMVEAGWIVEPSEWWHFGAMTTKEASEKLPVIE